MAFALGVVLECSYVFERQELQSINKRFEARPWLVWSSESLKRLNPALLWQYHERHEMPHTWNHWDWTLSWLIEHNHPPVMNHIVIFNRALEDEPPDEAVKQFPWMRPLLQYPLPRKTVAEMVDFLAASGAAAIVLDNDFPQHADGDADIARVIDKWNNKVESSKRVPILMVGTVNSGSDSRVMQLGVPTHPVGVLSELRALDPNSDLEQKYIGTTCVFQDADQVVRGIFLNRNVAGKQYNSIIIKLLNALKRPIPADLPEGVMDIDFGSPPRSDLYPTRSLSYLLDPDRKKTISDPNGEDVNVKGAVVFIGDGITDIYSTPFTNDGNNQMTGTEILAHALETVSRHSWPTRLSWFETVLYLALTSCLGALFWVSWKAMQIASTVPGKIRHKSVVRLLEDLCMCVLMVLTVYLAPCLIFNCSGFLVPMFDPTIAVAFGAFATILFEREHEREEKFHLQLSAAEEKLVLTQEKYEAELKSHEAEARSREMLIDKKRRHEFVRRINHDLNAPVSVLNWTVSELQMMDLQNTQAKEKVSRLVKSSDKLGELIDQLVQSYDYETVPNESGGVRVMCDLASVVHDCVDGQKPLATMHEDILEWDRPSNPMIVKANQLELTRVIDNIIRNAVKHNPKGTKVKVTALTNGRFHLVSISDTGKGIAPEHVENIFQPGFRVEPANKDGQGLGLDIAKTLIEAMGGEISVESQLRKGTTFKLKIPKYNDEEAEPGGGTPGKGNDSRKREPVTVSSSGSSESDRRVNEGNG